MSELSNYNISTTKLHQFNKAGIFTDLDLLNYIPKRYTDYGLPVTDFTTFKENGKYAIVGKIIGIAEHNKCFSIMLEDKSGNRIRIFSFNRYIQREFELHSMVLITCSITYSTEYDSYSGVLEHYYDYDPSIKGFHYMAIQPEYKQIKGMSINYLLETISNILSVIELEDYPHDFLKKFELCTREEAFSYIHYPHTMKEIEIGRKRLDFDKIFSLCCYLQIAEDQNDEKCSFQFNKETINDIWNTTIKKLPFSLTKSQISTLTDIRHELCRGSHLESLVQGDVGSGKTMIALFSALAAYANGFQCVVIAPTDVLASQHFEEFTNYCNDTYYLSGSTKAKEKKEIYKIIENEQPCILVGTHSLLQESVPYKNLALAVIDEEHRFGVNQRDFIKSFDKIPHIISMSATPIPRTMAMAMNHMNIRVFNIERPEGRIPIDTQIVPIKECYKKIDEEIKAGHQAYIICPMIDSNDKNDLQSTSDELVSVRRFFYGKTYAHPCMINGKMKKADISHVLDKFQKNEYNILISTTIVEVGVNVPNATVMLIKNSERFGLAQMHQLRGRVGRSSIQSYCLLATDEPTDRDYVLCRTNDGFEIAEEDMNMRGSGHLIGTKQSGTTEISIFLQKYPELFKQIKYVVRDIFYGGFERFFTFAYKD